MFKKVISSFLLVTLLGFGLSAQRIAIVDINDVLENFSEYKTAESQINSIASTWEQEIAQEFDKIKSMYNKYQAEQVLLSNDQRAQREEEIMEAEKQVREMQRQKFGPEGELFQKRQQLVAPIQDKVYSAIEDFAADRGYDLIFDKSGSAGLLFSSDEYDKTQEVKNRLGIK